MSSYRPSGGGGRGGRVQIVLGFGNVSDGAIDRGIEAVADLL
jgi:hypothetical protein